MTTLLANPSTLIVLDSGLKDYQNLLNSINTESEVVVLDIHQDGVERITVALESYCNLESLHILSHGDSGSLQLGAVELDAGSLPRYAEQIRRWSNALTTQANILLYGCRVAAEEAGQAFVQQIAQLTGKSVAASSTWVGNWDGDRNWDLDFQIGNVTAELALAPAIQASYQGVFTMQVNSAGANLTAIATQLLSQILGNTTGLTKITATADGNMAAFGTFSSDPFGLGSGIVLSTGNVGSLPGPNQVENMSTEFTDFDISGVKDETVLTITFDALPGTAKAFFTYVFGSEEFLEYSGSSFNDTFELLINGTNVAKLANGNSVSVNGLVPNQNDPSTWSPEYVDNALGATSQGTELDGYTKPMVFAADLQAGQNTIVIRIRDEGDNQYDSAVFIKGGSLTTVQPVPPPAPANLDMTDATDTATPSFGASTTDNKTLDDTPDFTGTGRVGDIIKLYSDIDGEIGSAIVQANGTWSITAQYNYTSANPLGLLVGPHKITAKAIDPNNGLQSSVVVLDIFIDHPSLPTDVTAPNPPAGLDLIDGSDTINSFGAQSNTDNDTDDRTPTFSGTAEVGSTVRLFSDKGGEIGSVRVGRSGTWSITSKLLQSGVHQIRTTATDVKGNASDVNLSQMLEITVRNVSSRPDLVASSDSGRSNSDNITNDATPTFTGTVDAGTLVTLRDKNNNVLGTDVADANGVWEITSSQLAERDHEVFVVSKNQQFGLEDDASQSLQITIDRTVAAVPGLPDLIAASDNGASSTDNETSVKTPTFEGTGEPGSLIELYSETQGLLGKAIVDANGKWVISLGKRNPLKAGDHQITAKATDVAGNTNPIVSPTLNISSLPNVSEPDLIDADDSGTSNTDNLTKVKTPRFSGMAELGSVVELYDQTNTLIGTFAMPPEDADGDNVVDQDNGMGSWEILSTKSFPEGTHQIRAVVTKNGKTNTSSDLTINIDFDNGAPTPAPSMPNMTDATDSGTNTSDNITVNRKPVFDGTSAAQGLIIKLYDGATLIGEVVSGTGGAWSITPSNNLSVGDHTITATATDAAGNVSVASGGLTTKIVAPPTVSSPDMTAGTDSNIATDNITNNKRPVFTGTTNQGTNTVEIFVDGVSQGNATLTGTNWSFTPGADLADKAEYKIEAVATDIYGNKSSKPSLNFTIDTVAPAAPSAIDLDTPSDSGASNSDNLTNDSTPTLSGTAEPSSTVNISSDKDGLIGTVTTDASGKWVLNSTSKTLQEGIHQITATATDAAGNISPNSTQFAITIDTLAPAAPTAPVMDAASDTGIANNDGITSNLQPEFIGTAEANSKVELVDELGAVIGTGTADGSGNWKIKVTPGRKGTIRVKARATDAAGNVSSVSPETTMVIDDTAPIVTVDSLLTKDDRPKLTGTVDDANAVVKVTVNGVEYTATNLGGGKWELADDTISAALLDGQYDVTAVATDKAGNVGTEATTKELTIDTTAPLAPGAIDLDALTDSGASNSDDVTSFAQPTLSGIAEANSTVNISSDKDGLIGTVTADASGNWKLNSTSKKLQEGVHQITATATDAAGNISPNSAQLAVTIDTLAPTAPTTPVMDAVSDTGLANNDGITKTLEPEFIGTAEPNSTVELVDDLGAVIGTGKADATGAWKIKATPGRKGTFKIKARATDTAGNVSPASSEMTVVIDDTAPVVTVDAKLTNDRNPKLTGTVDDADAIVKVTVAGKEYTATNLGNGRWELANGQIAPDLTDGYYDITAVATDKAGNVGTDVTNQELEIDITAPSTLDAPVLDAASDTGLLSTDGITKILEPEFVGTAEPNSTIELVDDLGNVIGSGKADASGNWKIKATPGRKGTIRVKARATDVVGNLNVVSPETEIVIDDTAPIVTVDSFLTKDNTPKLTGTVDDANAVVKVTVNGVEYTATNLGGGKWELADDTISTALLDGQYDVTAVATDKAGNVGTEATTKELTIDATAPATLAAPVLDTASDTGISDSDRITKVLEPEFVGTAEANSTVELVDELGTVIGTAKADATGAWKIKATPNRKGAIRVKARAIDAAGNSSILSPETEVVIDDTAPVVTVNNLVTNDGRPQLTGQVDTADATIKVMVNSKEYDAVNNGDGTWTLADDTILEADALADGTYDVLVKATDKAGNVGLDQSSGELTVETVAPNITVTELTTREGTPTLSGTVDDVDTAIKVMLNDVEYDGINQGDGTWTLPGSALKQVLSTGKYSIKARATDKAGNVSTDKTELELTVTAPEVTLSLSESGIKEEGGSTVITATLGHPADRDVVINLGFSGSTLTEDFQAQASILISKGQTSASIPLTAINDDLVEGTEGIIVDIVNVVDGSAVEVTEQRLNINIFDDDTNNKPVTSEVNMGVAPGTTASIKGMSATDLDGTIASYTIISLPAAEEGVLFLGSPLTGGTPIIAGQVLKADQIGRLFFRAGASFKQGSFTYVATDDKGATDATPATVILGSITNVIPEAKNGNQSLGAGKVSSVARLIASDADGSIASYTITSLPAANQGSLFLGDPSKGGTPVQAGQVLTPEQAGQLFFKSSSRFSGANFTYAVTDNSGALSGRLATVVLTDDDGTGLCKVGIRRKGSSGKNSMNGTAGADRLTSLGGNDQVRGRDCNDIIQGGKGKDRLFGDAGNDVLQGGASNDRLRGGTGRDILVGGQGVDTLSGDASDDILRGGMKRDSLFGGTGIDRLLGGAGNDFLRGDAGDDQVQGGAGRDKLRGGAGNDGLAGGFNNDRLGGFQGNDVLRGGAGDDKAWGHGDVDIIYGGSGRDTLYGGSGNDRLYGGLKQDELFGGAGNDVLVGGNKADVLTGNGGADRFVYKTVKERGDQITDFKVTQDVIDLSGFKTNKPFEQFVKLVQVGSDTQVQVAAGNGQFQPLVTLANVQSSTLTANQFVL